MKKPDDLESVIESLDALKAGQPLKDANGMELEVIVNGSPVVKVGNVNWRVGRLGEDKRFLTPVLYYDELGEYRWVEKGIHCDGWTKVWEA